MLLQINTTYNHYMYSALHRGLYTDLYADKWCDNKDKYFSKGHRQNITEVTAS